MYAANAQNIQTIRKSLPQRNNTFKYHIAHLRLAKQRRVKIALSAPQTETPRAYAHK